MGTLLQAHTRHEADVLALAAAHDQDVVFAAGGDGQVFVCQFPVLAVLWCLLCMSVVTYEMPNLSSLLYVPGDTVSVHKRESTFRSR